MKTFNLDYGNAINNCFEITDWLRENIGAEDINWCWLCRKDYRSSPFVLKIINDTFTDEDILVFKLKFGV